MAGRAERANRARREAIGRVSDAIAKGLIDKGLLIEAGFSELIRIAYPQGVGAEQRKQLRAAFFGGAQHLLGSIQGVLEPGSEPTDNDMRRMDLIAHELDGFIAEFKHEHKIGDDVIAPESGTRQ